MRIGMILDLNFPPDIRVENEATTLVKAGHEVFILCFDYNNNLPKEEIHRGINIRRIYKTKKWANRGRGLINTVLDFYTPFWARHIEEFVIQNQIEVLHIHDLYLVGAGLRANRKLKLPLIEDLHENYVEGLKHYKFANTFPGKYIISISKWEKKEQEWCQKANHMITVIDEAVNRYKKIGVPEEKIHVVANYVNIDEFLSNPVDPTIARKYQNDFVLMYIGGFDIHRGLETAVRAMPIVLKKYSQAKLVLVGRGRNQGDLKQLAVKLNIYNNVVFEGFQPSEKLPSYISASDICLIPHLKTVHTDNTIPHKLFHYMLLEKPVIATDCNPIQRIIEETKCGLIYENRNSHKLADAVIKLHNNQLLRHQMGANGRKAVLGKYNWKKTSGNLIEMYKMIGEDVKK